jgi:23S rRNA A1618 N6-methylase RlmF
MRGPLIASIKSLDKTRYTKIVKDALKKQGKLKLMQATKALKFAITEDTEQWLNYCVLVRKSSLSKIISKLLEFVKHMFWTSLFRSGEFKRFIRRYMSREALTALFEEKLTIYPSNPIFKLIEEKGIWTYKWPL